MGPSRHGFSISFEFPVCFTADALSPGNPVVVDAIHAQEALLHTLRAHQQRPEGRARLHERTTVEHALARVEQIQGPKARDTGVRKNTLNLRRVAVIANLQRIARLPKAA